MLVDEIMDRNREAEAGLATKLPPARISGVSKFRIIDVVVIFFINYQLIIKLLSSRFYPISE